MGTLLVILGVGVIAFTMVDALWTTLYLRRAGPVASWLASLLWRGAKALDRATGRRRRIISLAGSTILIVVILTWVLLLWGGWLLIFLSSPDAVVNSTTLEPASFWTRVYFTGFTLFTLGIGDFAPGTAPSRVATALGSINGFFLVTLAISYVIPVLSAAVDTRRLGACVWGLGETPHAMITRAWTGRDFDGLPQHLTALPAMIELYAQRHLAYPILRYFRSSERGSAVELSLAILHETVILLRFGVAREARPAEAVLVPVERAIADFADAIRPEIRLLTDGPPPPLPDLEDLREAGVPTADEATFRRAAAERAELRRLLCALVCDARWEWSEVFQRSGPRGTRVDLAPSAGRTA